MNAERFEIDIAGVERFMQQHHCLYASGGVPHKRLLISLACGPERFKVEVEGKEPVAFTDLEAAVKYFNER